MKERRYEHLHVHGPFLGLTFAADEVGGDRQFEAVIIRSGVYVPGIGNATGRRIRFTAPFLARIAPSGEGKKVDLEHSDRLEDEVGVMTQVRMDADSERMRSNLILQKKRPRFMDAIGFIMGRLDAKMVPNVSIELSGIVTRPAQTPAELLEFDEDMVDAVLDGVAILPQGACSDKAGCGIGLAAPTETNFTVHALQGKGHIGDDHMCDQKQALEVLQGKVTTLEADLTKTKADLTAASKERDTLKAAADTREKEDIEDLTVALKESLPKGTDIEAMVGKQPTVASLTVALKAAQAAKPPEAPPAAAGAKRVALGRHTAPVTRKGDGEPAPTGADREARVLSLRKRFGLPEKTNLPASMARNSASLMLAAVPEDTRAEGAAE